MSTRWFRYVLLGVVSCGLVAADTMTALAQPLNRDVPMYTADPTDGALSAADKAGMLEFTLNSDSPQRSFAINAEPNSIEDHSFTGYASWDADNLYLSYEVLDTTPAYFLESTGALNAQDAVQPTFSPNRQPDTNGGADWVEPDPGFDGFAPLGTPIIFDLAPETMDLAGATLYGHGPPSADTTAGSVVSSTLNGDVGYFVEMSVPWASIMGDANYVPAVNDVHGFGHLFINGVLDPAPGPQSLMWDWGGEEGTASTIALIDEWPTMTLQPPKPVDGVDADLNDDGFVDGLDLGILLGEWNPQVAAAMGISGGGAVPEPTSAVLLVCGCCLLGLRRKA